MLVLLNGGYGWLNGFSAHHQVNELLDGALPHRILAYLAKNLSIPRIMSG